MKKISTLLAAILMFSFVKAQDNEKEMARALITENRQEIGLTEDDLDNVIIKDAYYNVSAGTRMVYLQQSYLGLPVYNQLQVLAFKDRQLVSLNGNRIRKIRALAGSSAIPAYPAEIAVVTALRSKNIFDFTQLEGKIAGGKLDFGTLGVCSETVTAELMWLPLNDAHEVHLVWQIRVVPLGKDDYFMIRVDAMTNRVIDENNFTVYCQFGDPGTAHVHDEEGMKTAECKKEANPLAESPDGVNIISNASYKVIPFPAESPNHPGGSPAVVNTPWAQAPGNATTLGWHNDGITDYNISRGNNVYAQEDRDNNNTSFGGSALSSSSTDPLNFASTPDFTQAPTIPSNQQFALTNLFYWNNIIHDISYIHGFDEVSGNFQKTNLGRGGQGGDFVIADCQDAGGTNNANFATPDDGSNPRMQMYLWSGTPQKDGSLDNGVVSHEFFHGVSNRLTGGPSSSGCLTNAEQMGEGWSDYFSLMITQNWATSTLTSGYDAPRSVGTYAAGQPITGRGIRTQRYSTNMTVNSKVYLASLPAAQHDRGEIWCAALWDMTWNIINQTGQINASLFDTSRIGGNSVALRLVQEGMKLQPCNPGFISGRNAILKADSILYGGEFNCAIKEAFRRRGMGALASEGSTNSVIDQVPDYTGGVFMDLTQGGITGVTEGQEITYTHTVKSSCAAISNYTLRDTLPSSVTYVSGGNYDAASRVVSFNVTQPIGATGLYSFKVKVNSGTYFTPSYPLQDSIQSNSLPAGWINTSTPADSGWKTSTLASHSTPYSLYVKDLTIAGNQQLTTPLFSLPAGTMPRFHFWHKYNTEDGWDGGVVEITTNGGSVWTDLGSLMTKNSYNSSLGAAPTCVLQGRQAFTGSIEDFQRTTIDLTNYAGASGKIRFWFASDDNTTAPTAPQGWFVDDVLLEVAPIVKMRATLYNENNIRIASSDTVTYILNAPVCVNASITDQPASIAACVGGDAVFTVSGQGTDNNYQWQVSNNGGASFSDIPGATNDSLVLNTIGAALNFNLYRVVISNACPSSITSVAAMLRVSDPALISQQPGNNTVCIGQNAIFSVTATGGITGYQWQISTDGGTSFNDVVNETAASITIPVSAISQNGNIYRVSINSCNDALSSTASLTVQRPPVINSDPQSITVCSGNNHTFRVAAQGTNITYQWQVSSNGGTSYSSIPGATADTLALSAINSGLNNYRYRVIINGTCQPHDTSAAALLSVASALNITTQPSDLTICAGNDAVISISATGAVGYQWQVSTDGGASWNNISNAVNSILLLSPVTSALQRHKYRVVLSNCGADIISAVATLVVKDPVTIISQPANTGICEGGNGSISVSATGSDINYQWQISTDGGVNWSDIGGATSTTLNFSGVTGLLNGNNYRVIMSPAAPCQAYNSNAALLTVNPLPLVSAQASPGTAVCTGSPLILTGSGASTYTWNGSVVNGTAFTPVSPGTFIVTGTDANGCSNTDTIDITLKAVPTVSISATPANTALLPGDSVTLTAVSNPPSAQFTWYRNNFIVPGITGNKITVISSTIGSYKAMVTDAQNDCSNTSNIITVKDSVRTNVFIFPNPNTGHFTVRLPQGSITGNYLVAVWDSKGALVHKSTSRFENQQSDFTMDQLAAGMYFIRVMKQNGEEIRTGKLIIGHH